MSDRLSVSAALSVLLMAGYVLFGTEAARLPLGPEAPSLTVEISAPALPEVARLLPLTR